MLQRIFHGLVDLLAPPVCVACDNQLGTHLETFCEACEPLVEPWLGEPDAPFVALFRYGGPVADAIRRLKYEGRSEVAQAFQPWLESAAAELRGQVDLVTAVPLTRAKLVQRGYNQSSLLAQPLARALAVPFRPTALVRVREVGRQVGRDRSARLAHMQGAFAARGALQGKRVMVVDDVRTTGATLAEATRALLEAGAHTVRQLVLAEADDLPKRLPLY